MHTVVIELWLGHDTGFQKQCLKILIFLFLIKMSDSWHQVRYRYRYSNRSHEIFWKFWRNLVIEIKFKNKRYVIY